MKGEPAEICALQIVSPWLNYFILRANISVLVWQQVIMLVIKVSPAWLGKDDNNYYYLYYLFFFVVDCLCVVQ